MARRTKRQAEKIEGPELARQNWHARGPQGPHGECLAIAPKYLRSLLADGYRNSWERNVVMRSEPINERKRAPVPVQNWEASAQARRYAI